MYTYISRNVLTTIETGRYVDIFNVGRQMNVIRAQQGLANDWIVRHNSDEYLQVS